MDQAERLAELSSQLASIGLAKGWPPDRNAAVQRTPTLLKLLREYSISVEMQTVEIKHDDEGEVGALHEKNKETVEFAFELLARLRALRRTSAVPPEFRKELNDRLGALIRLVTEFAAGASIIVGDPRYLDLGFSAVPNLDALPTPDAEGLFDE